MARPQTWVEWADFFSKAVLGLAALMVTASTAYLTREWSARKDAREQEERDLKAFDDLLTLVPEDQKDTLKGNRASIYCSGTSTAQARSIAVADLCTWVAKLGKDALVRGQDTRAANIRSTASQGVAAVLNSPAVTSQNFGVAAAEAAQPAAIAAPWFAVVGTVPDTTDPIDIKLMAQQLNAKLMKAGLPPNDVHIYRTKISKSFAFTSGKGKSVDSARARVAMLKKSGFADAFAQRDREWSSADDLQ